jgi:hypothetical protein
MPSFLSPILFFTPVRIAMNEECHFYVAPAPGRENDGAPMPMDNPVSATWP